MLSVTRIASRYMKRALETSESDEDLKGMADFLASQVGSMDDESVAFASYVCEGIPGERQKIIDTLFPKLLLSYRKRLIEWFEFALLKRANLGGGGKGIQRMEDGLAAFIEAIPDLIASRKSFSLSDFVPDNEYLNPDMMDKVAQRVVKGVMEDAMKAGVFGTMRVARALPLSVTQDRSGLWFIPPAQKTYAYRDDLNRLGFKWNRDERRWEVPTLTPAIQRDLQIQPLFTVNPEALKDWFFNTWYPSNADRITKVFTDYARDKQTSYKLFFKVGAGGKPEVKFSRDISTAWEAVEELRYRYIGRQGRQPWLEVLDMFVELVRVTSTAQLPRIIDRINNLQHSNGLFMEHFPSSVKSWYGEFLNAKYNAPKPDDLAKFIPDRDLRGLLISVARTGYRPYGWASMAPPAYHLMKKELADVGNQVNWREKNYPRFKGEKGAQPDRFDPIVQRGLDVLKKLHKQRESLLSVEPQSQQAYEKWVGAVVDWNKDYDQARVRAEKLLQAERQRQLEDPSHAADWEARNFPKEFLEQFPWAVPGISKSELAPFLTRYAGNRAN